MIKENHPLSEDRSNLKKKILSVVVSVYNEEQALEECYTEMKRVLDTLSWDHELIFVNDGSSDGSLEVLKWMQICSIPRNVFHGSSGPLRRETR